MPEPRARTAPLSHTGAQAQTKRRRRAPAPSAAADLTARRSGKDAGTQCQDGTSQPHRCPKHKPSAAAAPPPHRPPRISQPVVPAGCRNPVPGRHLSATPVPQAQTKRRRRAPAPPAAADLAARRSGRMPEPSARTAPLSHTGAPSTNQAPPPRPRPTGRRGSHSPSFRQGCRNPVPGRHLSASTSPHPNRPPRIQQTASRTPLTWTKASPQPSSPT